MKKLQLFSAFIFISTIIYGQKTEPIDLTNLIVGKKIEFCGGISFKEHPVKKCKDKTHFIKDEKLGLIHNKELEYSDRFGNIYCDYVVDLNFKETKVNRQAGNFILTTSQSMPQEIREVAVQVLADLSELIVTHPNPCRDNSLKILLYYDSSLTGNVGAVGSSYYLEHGVEFESKAWREINGTLNRNFRDQYIGYIGLNRNIVSNLYTGFSTDQNNDGIMDEAPDKLSLYHIILHETLHILGFSSNIIKSNNGNYSLRLNRPRKLDFLMISNNERFFNGFFGMNFTTTNALSSTNINASCNVNFEGNNLRLPAHVPAPSNFNSKGGIAHFAQENCGNGENRVMNYSITPGEHTIINEDEINVLKNLGYTTTNTYGTQSLLNNGSPNPFFQRNDNFRKNANITHDDNNNGCNMTNAGVLPQSQIPVFECSNDGSYFISNEILLKNDIISNFQRIELADTNSGTINITTQGLELTTNSSGSNHRIRYVTRNKNGYLSNVAYFHIFIKPCSNFSNNFNCTNTTECNLICNPHIMPSNNFIGTNGILFGSNFPNNSAVPGWFPYTGNVAYYSNNVQGGGNLPSQGQFQFRSLGSMMTKVNLKDNTNYIVSSFTNYNYSYQRYEMLLGTLNNEYYFLDNNDFNNTTSIFRSIEQPSLKWRQNITTFSTFNNNKFDILIFRKTNAGHFFYLDDVQLIEDRLNEENIQTKYFNTCNETYTIGADLCEEIFGVNYSWYDVTDSNNIIRLTNGNNDLGTNDSFEPIGNGSQLEVNVEETKVLELRRTFNNRSSNITIATNDADASIQVTLNCSNNCSPFPKKYAGFDTTGNKQGSFNIITDSENNLIVSGTKSTPTMTFEGLDLPYNYFVAKYSENGCLLWIKEVNSLVISSFVDSNDNILVTHNLIYPNLGLSKYDTNGNLVWDIEITDSYHRHFSIDSDNNFYVYNQKNIIKIDSNGNIENIITNIPNDIHSISSPFFISDNGQEAYLRIMVGYTTQSFNFAGGIISPPQFPVITKSYLLKYNLNNNTLTPVSFIEIKHGDLFFNSNTNHIISSYDKVRIYDSNLNKIIEINNPGGKITFNHSKDRLLIFNSFNETIHTLIDDGISTNFTSIRLNLTANGIGKAYPNLAQDTNSLIYLATTKPPFYQHYISKIDPITGQLLERSNNLVQKETKEKTTHLLQQEKEEVVKISPNPFTKKITLNFYKKQEYTITLINSLGSKLFTKKVNNQTVNLHLENYPQGVYFLHCTDTNGKLTVKQIIKQ